MGEGWSDFYAKDYLVPAGPRDRHGHRPARSTWAPTWTPRRTRPATPGSTARSGPRARAAATPTATSPPAGPSSTTTARSGRRRCGICGPRWPLRTTRWRSSRRRCGSRRPSRPSWTCATRSCRPTRRGSPARTTPRSGRCSRGGAWAGTRARSTAPTRSRSRAWRCRPRAVRSARSTARSPTAARRSSGATVSIGARTATTDANGNYTLSNLPAQTYAHAVITAPGYDRAVLDDVAVPGEADAQLRRNWASVRGGATATSTDRQRERADRLRPEAGRRRSPEQHVVDAAGSGQAAGRRASGRDRHHRPRHRPERGLWRRRRSRRWRTTPSRSARARPGRGRRSPTGTFDRRAPRQAQRRRGDGERRDVRPAHADDDPDRRRVVHRRDASSPSTASPEPAAVTTIVSGPTTPVGSTPTFTFSPTSPASRFECRLDGAPFTTCTSPIHDRAVRTGAHTFEVYAVNQYGTADRTPASRTSRSTRSCPRRRWARRPSALTERGDGHLHFTGNGSSFECSRDGAAFAACTSRQNWPVAEGDAHLRGARGQRARARSLAGDAHVHGRPHRAGDDDHQRDRRRGRRDVRLRLRGR